MVVTLTGLDEVLVELRDELRRLNDKVDALSASNGHVAIGWYDTESAAAYLSLSRAAMERAARRGTIECTRTANGRIRFSREQLDRYVDGGAKP